MAAVAAADIMTGAAELGLQLTQQQGDQLARFCVLLTRWNSVHNLTAIESPREVLTHHVLDCLAVVPELSRWMSNRPQRVLDVGSGGGLPGIPLAVALPGTPVTLIDRVRKKVAFLTQAKLDLGLESIEPLHLRVEDLRAPPRFDVIAARAFSSLLRLVECSRHLLASDGIWAAMKGVLPTSELAELPDYVAVVATVKLRVPQLSADRHLIVLRLRSQTL